MYFSPLIVNLERIQAKIIHRFIVHFAKPIVLLLRRNEDAAFAIFAKY